MAGIDRMVEGVDVDVGVSSMCRVRFKYGRRQVGRRDVPVLRAAVG